MVRATLALLPSAVLAGCAASPAPDDGTIAWSGYVYTGAAADVPYSASTDPDATLTFTPDDADPVDATEPYPDYPGYWSVELPASTPLTVRVGTAPAAVWRADSPDRDASWFSGALFGADPTETDALLAALGGAQRAPAATGNVTVVGTPYDADAAPWECADVRVGGQPVECFVVDSDGVVSAVTAGPLDYFVATGVPAGQVEVASGLGAVEVYPLEAGQVGMAFWFNGGS